MLSPQLFFGIFVVFTVLALIGLSGINKRIQPDRKIRILLPSFLAFACIEALFIYFIFINPSIKENAILESGIAATGKIISVRATGNKFNYNPEVEILVEINDPGGSAYTAKTIAVLDPVELQKYVPGASLDLKIDKNDKNNFLIIDPVQQ